MLYPMKMKAALKDYLWGGTRLKREYGKQTELKIVAESWELSCHKDGQSVIENGTYQGMTLTDFIEREGKSVLGTNAAQFENFPILIKFIDAADNLSVQVHPNNDYALRVEGEYGKTEMWYIVDCEEGASLLYGFKKVIDKAEFQRRIEQNTLLEVCNSVPVKKGDVFFIDAGTMHAIGKGILIAEIQQNSNSTYRIYDFGRVGVDGKPRQLHVEKALDVTQLCPPGKKNEAVASMRFFQGYSMNLLATCQYFTTYQLGLETEGRLTAGKDSFQSFVVLDGDVALSGAGQSLRLQRGDSVFIPAGMGDYCLTGKGELIFSMV